MMDMIDNNRALSALVRELGEHLRAAQWCLSTAESCTGGLVAATITAVADSSDWFDRGFITYSIPSKTEMLGVSAALIEQYGAVSEPVACAMAEGALHHSHSQIALAITGIAGPTDAGENKPVGTVCFSWSYSGQTRCETMQFEGDRQQVCLQAVEHSLQGVLTCLKSSIIQTEN